MCDEIRERIVSHAGGGITISRVYVCTCGGLGIRDRTDWVDAPASHTYMRDEEVREALREYDDRGFDDLPTWLKVELHVRGLPVPTREPTEEEKRETEVDAFTHRVMNNQLTINDHYEMIVNGKDIFNV